MRVGRWQAYDLGVSYTTPEGLDRMTERDEDYEAMTEVDDEVVTYCSTCGVRYAQQDASECAPCEDAFDQT